MNIPAKSSNSLVHMQNWLCADGPISASICFKLERFTPRGA